MLSKQKFVLVVLSLVFCFSIVIEAKAADSLTGPAFGDPSAVIEMDQEWMMKPISYDSENSGADLVIVLNQQFYEFMLPYVESFAAEKGLKIVAKRGTCGISAGMLSKKQGDVGAFCCPPGNIDRLPGLRFHTVGIHPVSILVHPENPINDLSFEQIRKIFMGEISLWSEVGWNGQPVQAITRLHCKNRPGHWRLLLDNKNLFGAEVREVGAIEDMFSLVSTVPGAIGYEVMWLTNQQEGKVRSLKIDGHGPDDTEHLLAGAYPVYRTLYLTTWEDEQLKNQYSELLVNYLIDKVELHGASQGIVPVSGLRKAGWKFVNDELIGEPD